MRSVMRVWIGYSDGQPHAYECEIDGAGCVAVYKTRAEARKHYQDVRRGELIVEEPRKLDKPGVAIRKPSRRDG